MSQKEAAARVDGLDSADLLALVVAAATRLEQLSSAVSTQQPPVSKQQPPTADQAEPAESAQPDEQPAAQPEAQPPRGRQQVSVAGVGGQGGQGVHLFDNLFDRCSS